ncbi:Uncaracterized surface protein containing fasciclin (FAS1) repeats [Bacteroides luti]|uniref:Uncaracterized surface protein containing fasciclin (FAS1) repeats n=1 Tax=Bacteroides luti TaxID=1297750 RepID=A0A1M5F141_9BACE|nr:fasciclin domain-containing protein [Bacteroides luti]SHF85253.1 Uncaracterized surface protein containing fasciclin (FAS1) repeats [Bacteroides luti]
MKRNKLINISLPIWLFCVLALITGLSSCETELEKGVYKTADLQMIDEYMENKDANLSEFLQIIDKADYRGMLHAYGTYTCFAPTNAAIDNYLKEKGKTLEGLTKEEAEQIVKFHVINDTISTLDFVDGRLPSTNINRDYLTTKTEVDNAGDVYIKVNRQARITAKNILLGNGYIHVVDNVLKPAQLTLAQTFAALPDAEYSLMKEIAVAADFNSTLQTQESGKYFTFFVQDNKTFEDLGIKTVEDLLVRLRKNSPAISDDKVLLYNFLAYHTVGGRVYVTDLMATSSLPTLVKNQPLTFQLNNEFLVINEFKVGQLNEEGIQVDRNSEYSDLTCTNGVMHRILGQIEIKKRKAYRVYWDMADMPEIKALKGYRKAGTTQVFLSGELSEMTWGGKSNPTVTYIANGTSWNEKGQYVYGDMMRFRICTNVMQWVEFKMPLLVEGTYKVWISWRRANPATFRTSFKQDGQEDQILPTVVDMSSYMPIYWQNTEKTILDGDKMESEGWKQYNAKKVNSVMCCKLMGTIKVLSTGRHILRLDALSGSKGYGNDWDMIQFIPVDEDQQWPKIAMNGDWIENGTLDNQIFPDGQ